MNKMTLVRNTFVATRRFTTSALKRSAEEGVQPPGSVSQFNRQLYFVSIQIAPCLKVTGALVESAIIISFEIIYTVGIWIVNQFGVQIMEICILFEWLPIQCSDQEWAKTEKFSANILLRLQKW